ncbi:MAG: outer membrane beta-barrel protein [Gemmatimonadota bacterium]
MPQSRCARRRDSALITGALTDANGRFRIDGMPAGAYLVNISFLGYKARVNDVVITAEKKLADIGAIQLKTDVIAVEGVTAEAQRSAVTIAPDRSVYTTKSMLVASGGTATDVLRNVPELQVDPDGGVRLNGSQSVVIHINGRPSPIRGEALKTFLQQMPANRIDRVEVIPNPSAKYDPEGISGIVNLVLKENVDLGLSGSVFAGTDSRARHNLGLNIANQSGPWTVFANGSVNRGRNTMGTFDSRQNLSTSPRTIFEADVDNEMRGRFGWFDGSVERKTSKLSTAYASLRTNRGTNDMEGISAYSLLDAARVPTSQFSYLNDNNCDFFWFDAALGFRRIVKSQQHEFSVEVRRTNNTNEAELDYVRQVLSPSDNSADELGLVANETGVTDHILQVDYTRPLTPQVKLETGYKGALRGTDFDNDIRRFVGTTSTQPVALESTLYQYHEDYHQAYVTLAKQFGKLGAQIGARAEIANTEFELPTETFADDYQSLFPSLNLAYTHSKAWSSRAAYSKRIERPWPGMLNPTPPNTDSLNRFVGNPEPRPKFTHSLTYDLTRTLAAGQLKLSPYFRRTTDNWEYSRTVDARGIATVMWINTSQLDTWGATTTVSLRAGEKANGFLNLNLFHYDRDASAIAGANNLTGFQWEMSGNGNAQLKPGLFSQAFLRYAAPMTFPQGRMKGGAGLQ